MGYFPRTVLGVPGRVWTRPVHIFPGLYQLLQGETEGQTSCFLQKRLQMGTARVTSFTPGVAVVLAISQS